LYITKSEQSKWANCTEELSERSCSSLQLKKKKKSLTLNNNKKQQKFGHLELVFLGVSS